MTDHLPDSFYQPFLSDAAKIRKPSPIHVLVPLESTPGVISLMAGKPNGDMFPFRSFKFTIAPTTLPNYAESLVSGAPLPGEEVEVELSGDTLRDGLQYGPTEGLPKLHEWYYGLQERYHGRKRDESWILTLGSGSQDLIFKAANSVLNPGDVVLIEAPAYGGVIPIFQNLQCEFVEIPMDAHGLRSQDLREVLNSWPSDKPKPKILYTVPYGSNPGGFTTSEDRKKEVIELAREHNFLIFEDDPYFYLYFGDAPRPASYFSLEQHMPTKDGSPRVGRVLRFDSMSKVASGGLRLGIASGPAPLVKAINSHTSSSSLQSFHLGQAIMIALFEKWGYEGFDAHIRSVSTFYRAKRDIFQKVMKECMSGLAEWTPPEAGMFFWFKLLLNPNANAGDDDGDSSDLISNKAFKNGVLALPGAMFYPNGRKSAHVRAAFSLLSEEQVREALRRLRETVLKEREGV
ncbi:PLP-dependent transferase [Coniophora puteana RWD-64-598 SS2]|uniref:PLP-dependent transferase n=1 Tax=Coniophora puteana (strain RWD-64-598) TaxID=741705 RepID=A0A5M3MZ53_CONPW|nr:PLP-dependent transferase [Coniophora puteana RWD-64-598 SS2]EIW84422.1 PLP-dependent transferase [Coniophora puteana RWD-64-598 SS2]